MAPSAFVGASLTFGAFGVLFGVNKWVARIAALDSPMGHQCRDLYRNFLYYEHVSQGGSPQTEPKEGEKKDS
jgi:hypothetical protein